MKQLQYDYTFMLNEFIRKHGASEEELSSLHEKILTFRQSAFVAPGTEFGFMQLPSDYKMQSAVSALAQTIKSTFKTLIVLGIGGSDLGSRAVIEAFPTSNGMEFIFLGSNTDPNEIDIKLTHVEWSDTAVNVISKSGDTIETMATFLYVRNKLIHAVGKENHINHIVATTGTTGTLHEIAIREGYRTLDIPEDVGGRFSVLSAVGLFPIACSGISIAELCLGAAAISEGVTSSSSTEYMGVELFAALHYLGFKNRSQNINVLIPYSFLLRQVSFWFRQLWAESLGKKDSIDNREIFTGPTPVAALGATDQHSQFQLYYYGPFDKIITFIDVENYNSTLHVPTSLDEIEELEYLKGIEFQKIIRAELLASALALAERERPSGRIIIPEISPYYVGQLIQFLEIATTYMGMLLSVNPFDQPGVELGKQNMYALLGRPGYDKRADELTKLLKNNALKVV